jgi:hypothetical protein
MARHVASLLAMTNKKGSSFYTEWLGIRLSSRHDIAGKFIASFTQRLGVGSNSRDD